MLTELHIEDILTKRFSPISRKEEIVEIVQYSRQKKGLSYDLLK